MGNNICPCGITSSTIKLAITSAKAYHQPIIWHNICHKEKEKCFIRKTFSDTLLCVYKIAR